MQYHFFFAVIGKHPILRKSVRSISANRKSLFMNSRRVLVSIAFGLSCVFSSSAQVNAYQVSARRVSPKPSLFAGLPVKNDCSAAVLETLFRNGKEVCIPLGNGVMKLQGEIVLRKIQNPVVQTLTIRLPEFPEGYCTLSRIQEENGAVRYSGRIMSPSYDDALILECRNGTYSFVRTEKKQILAE